MQNLFSILRPLLIRDVREDFLNNPVVSRGQTPWWKKGNLKGEGKGGNLPGMGVVVLPSSRSIGVFCESHGIERLRLFGSAARNDFDAARSDVDLLVEYEKGKHPGLDHFLVAEEMSELFGRKVDLNTPAMLGRYLGDVVKDAEILYGEA